MPTVTEECGCRKIPVRTSLPGMPWAVSVELLDSWGPLKVEVTGCADEREGPSR